MRARSLALLGLFVLACHDTAPPAEPDMDAPVKCAKDTDCSLGPCGPCESNAVFTQAMMMQECVVNPCPGKQAFCNADHVCALK